MRRTIISISAIMALGVSLGGCGTDPRSYDAPRDAELLYVFTERASDVGIAFPDATGDGPACEVERPPRHGKLRRRGSALVYSPYSSFRGADSFSCRRAGGDLLTVGVTVDRISVKAFDETDPIAVEGDFADDIAIWLHPRDPASSLILGTSKSPRNQGGISIYDLEGNELERGRGRQINNVDVRYGFPLNGEAVDIVAATNRTDDTIAVFGLGSDADLYNVGENSDGVFVNFRDDQSNVAGVYGFCLYRSPASGKLYGFVTSKTGYVAQIELHESRFTPGTIAGDVVRAFDVNPGRGTGDDNRNYIEGCVADDFHEALYIAEEDYGVWRYGAEPDDGVDRRLVDRTGPAGHLAPGGDVEGLAIYQATESTGYLIASSQGDNAFVIYDRCGGNEFIAKFEIVSGPDADEVSDADGIEVVSFGLGPAYPSGVFITQDLLNTVPGNAGNQNYKLVPWPDIAGAIEPPLEIRTDFDPRQQSR